jgi:hypothetical protein
MEGQEDLPTPTPEADKADDAPEKTNRSDIFKFKLHPNQQPALRETNGNKSPSRSPRKVAFSASIPNTPSQLENENADISGVDLVCVDSVEKPSRPTSVAKPPPSEERAPRPPSQDNRTPRHVRCDNLADQIMKMASKTTLSSPTSSLHYNSPLLTLHKSNDTRQTRKRHSSPRAHPSERSQKLTVQDKLREAAEAAAVADSVKAVSRSSNPTKKTDDGAEQVPDTATKKRAPRSPVKTRIGGRPKRRKSTLTPEELANLLGC